MNGEPDGAPIVPAFPLADMTSALYAVNADDVCPVPPRRPWRQPARSIDVSLFESLFSVARSVARGVSGARAVARTQRQPIEERRSARLLSAPSDGRFIAVSGSTPKMAERFLLAYELESSSCTTSGSAPTKRVCVMPRNLTSTSPRAIASRTLDENLRIIDEHALTAVAVQTVADIEQDPHWRARQLLRRCAERHGHGPDA